MSSFFDRVLSKSGSLSFDNSSMAVHSCIHHITRSSKTCNLYTLSQNDICCGSSRSPPWFTSWGREVWGITEGDTMKKRRNKTKTQHSLVLSRIGLPCPSCGEILVGDPGHPQYATLEHVIPLDHGGTNHLTNLDVICTSCNSARNSVKQHFDNRSRQVPKEYWQVSLRNSLIYIIDRFYKEYHIIFLNARFGNNWTEILTQPCLVINTSQA